MRVNIKQPLSIDGIRYAPGIQEVPNELAGHWYYKAQKLNGSIVELKSDGEPAEIIDKAAAQKEAAQAKVSAGKTGSSKTNPIPEIAPGQAGEPIPGVPTARPAPPSQFDEGKNLDPLKPEDLAKDPNAAAQAEQQAVANAAQAAANARRKAAQATAASQPASKPAPNKE